MEQERHLLVDCSGVARNLCLDAERFIEVMARASEKAGTEVVRTQLYRIGHESVPGFTAIIVLDESHCTIHTCADLGLVTLNIFTCGNIYPETLFNHMRNELDLGKVALRESRKLEITEVDPMQALT